VTSTAASASPAELRDLAVDVAREAAALVAQGRATAADSVDVKSSSVDVVTAVDKASEALIVTRLTAARPEDGVLGEEGASRAGTSGVRWVVDPIDGTVNFLYGVEGYAVSVAVQIDGASVAGAVANVPTGEVFSAAVGHGAQLRRAGAPTPTALRCTAVDDLSMALVGTGFSYAPEQRVRQGEVLTRLLPDIRDVRRFGSCALDLCMVAAGRLDAYYEDGVHVWDWAAGALIAAEAGAVLQLPPAVAEPGLIVASAPGIAAEFDGALRRAR
jgi:myo-inositol-1(or 4)-monophosphatase